MLPLLPRGLNNQHQDDARIGGKEFASSIGFLSDPKKGTVTDQNGPHHTGPACQSAQFAPSAHLRSVKMIPSTFRLCCRPGLGCKNENQAQFGLFTSANEESSVSALWEDASVKRMGK